MFTIVETSISCLMMMFRMLERPSFQREEEHEMSAVLLRLLLSRDICGFEA